MHAIGYIELTLAALIFLVVMRGLIKLFVYDEFGFRFSKDYQRRIEEDHEAFDMLIGKLTPAVLAIRRQQCSCLAKVIYSFCKSADGQIVLDEIKMFDGKANHPLDAGALPDDCKPLLKKIDNPRLRAAFTAFIKKRRSLKATDRIVVHSAGVSLAKIGSIHLPGPQLHIAVADPGKSTDAKMHSDG